MLERLLEPGSTDVPSCVCGAQMNFERTKVSDADTSIKVFRCSHCGHEMQLTVWASAEG
jgi:predicted SprT family Zn-dependent metalloprotease